MTNDWRKEANQGVRWGIGWYILFVLLILAVGAAIWALTVVLSAPKGQGDAIIQNNSAQNWTAKQAWFEDTYAEIKASDRKLDIFAEALAANPNDKTTQQNLTGLQSYCVGLVGEYNAEARKFLSEDWRSPDLPQEISNYDTATDCKENL